jgi:hypothetical protein
MTTVIRMLSTILRPTVAGSRCHGHQLQHTRPKPPVQVDLVEGADGPGQRSRLDPHAVPSTLAAR